MKDKTIQEKLDDDFNTNNEVKRVLAMQSEIHSTKASENRWVTGLRSQLDNVRPELTQKSSNN